MGYVMDMSGEKKSIRNDVLAEGCGKSLRIISCEESISKNGNEQFVFEFQEVSTGKVKTIYAISTQGKRWKLKSILTACGVSAGQDGVYQWEVNDVLSKIILADVVNNEEDFTNRKGEIKVILKTELYNFRKLEEKTEDIENLSGDIHYLKDAEIDLGGDLIL